MRRRVLAGGLGCLGVLLLLLLVILALIVGALTGVLGHREVDETNPTQTQQSLIGGLDADLTQITDEDFTLTRITVDRDSVRILGLSGAEEVTYSWPGGDREASDVSPQRLIGLDRTAVNTSRIEQLWKDAECPQGDPQLQVLGTATGSPTYSLLCPGAEPDTTLRLTSAWLGEDELTLPGSVEELAQAATTTLPALAGEAPLTRLALSDGLDGGAGPTVTVDQQNGDTTLSTGLSSVDSPGSAVTVGTTQAAQTDQARQFSWQDVDPQVLNLIAERNRADQPGAYHGLHMSWSEDYGQFVITTDTSDTPRTYSTDGYLLG